MDGTFRAVTPNLERSTGDTNADLNKKTVEGSPYGPAELNAEAPEIVRLQMVNYKFLKCLGLFEEVIIK